MRLQSLLSGLLFSAVIAAPVAFADPILQDWGFNVNGTYEPDQTASGGGLNLSGWDWNSPGTGTGTITFTTTTGGDFDFWIFDPVSGPAYNEYGATSGSAASGQSWQIDVPDYDSDTNHTGTIMANTAANTLGNSNSVPGTADDYFTTCSTGADCNDYVSMAMGFNYSAPAAGFEDVITYKVSTTAPSSGFYLEDIQPVDSADMGPNSSESILYLSGTLTVEPVSTSGVPEPKTSILLGAAMLLLAVCFRRRFVSAQPTR